MKRFTVKKTWVFYFLRYDTAFKEHIVATKDCIQPNSTKIYKALKKLTLDPNIYAIGRRTLYENEKIDKRKFVKI